MKRFYLIPLLFFMLFAFAPQSFAAPGYVPEKMERADLAFLYLDKAINTVQHRQIIDTEASQAGDYGAIQNADNPAINCSDLFEITELIKVDKRRRRLLSANVLSGDHRQHIPRE